MNSDTTKHSPTHGSASVHITTMPSEVYAFLTDLERLPTLSPENQHCEFLDGWTSIEIGARFRGYNEVKDYGWHADCEVTVAEPGRKFAYEVPPNFDIATPTCGVSTRLTPPARASSDSCPRSA